MIAAKAAHPSKISANARLAKRGGNSVEPATPQDKLARREAHWTQSVTEKALGTLFAAGRIPTNVASGLVVGAVQGFRKGSGKTEKVDATGTAIGQVGLNTLWGQAYAAATGFAIGGPIGAAANMALDGMGAGAGIYVFVKNGSAKEVGKRLSDAVNSSVSKADGGALGAFKGMKSAAWASAKAAAGTGWQEGKGTGAGVFDGAKAVGEQFLKRTRSPRGPLLRTGLKVAVGVATAALSAPAGVVTALTTSVDQKKTPGMAHRLLLAAASGATTVAAVGFVGGPLGMAVGAAVGATAGIIGPASRERFSGTVMRAVRHTESKRDDLGSDIANNNRAMFSKGIQGAAAAISHSWNLAV